MDPSIPNLLRELIREHAVRRDKAKDLPREKLNLACMVGLWSATKLFPARNSEFLLDWLDAATESDIEWLFDPHGEPR